MKKYYTTFRLFGKKYGVKRGGNLHFILEFVLPVLGLTLCAVLGYILMCMAITYENTVLL